MHELPQYSDVNNAYQRIKSYIHHTPIMSSQAINNIVGASIHFKCENLQKIGAFKIRGATNAILSQLEQAKQYGVATHSSGNHGAALALAAKQHGVQAQVVMPANANEVKRQAVAAYGAEIVTCDSNQQARESVLAELVKASGALIIHPYDDPLIIAGQGTCAIEFIQDNVSLDTLLTPVGGGGLLSGSAIVAKQLAKNCRVIGCEPIQADDAYQSFKARRRVTEIVPNTIADGLRAIIGQLNFTVISQYVDDILTVDEDEIIAAMRLLWSRLKLVVEPSSAVPLAAVIKYKAQFKGQHIGIILSGGNVDLDHLPWL